MPPFGVRGSHHCHSTNRNHRGIAQLFFGGSMKGSVVIDWDFAARTARLWFEDDGSGGTRILQIHGRWADDEFEREGAA